MNEDSKPLKTKSLDPSSASRILINREHVVQAYGLGRTVVRWIGGVIIAFAAKDMVIALAGEDTRVAIKLAFLGDLKFVLSWTVALSGVGWAVIERWLRYRKVEHMQGRIKQLETAVDPNRTSSHLTVQGKTNPGDVLP